MDQRGCSSNPFWHETHFSLLNICCCAWEFSVGSNDIHSFQIELHSVDEFPRFMRSRWRLQFTRHLHFEENARLFWLLFSTPRRTGLVFWTNSAFDTDYGLKQLHAGFSVSYICGYEFCANGLEAGLLWFADFLARLSITHIRKFYNRISGVCFVQIMNHEKCCLQTHASMTIFRACICSHHSSVCFDFTMYLHFNVINSNWLP